MAAVISACSGGHIGACIQETQAGGGLVLMLYGDELHAAADSGGSMYYMLAGLGVQPGHALKALLEAHPAINYNFNQLESQPCLLRYAHVRDLLPAAVVCPAVTAPLAQTAESTDHRTV
jgi:hypothetical protein